MRSVTLQERLFDLLHQYADQLAGMISLLNEEYDCLCARDVPALERCTEKKNRLLAQLSSIERDRNAVSSQLSCTIAEKDNNEATTSGDFKVLNEKIRSLLENCRDLNEVNGAIIDISCQFSQRLLHTIIGDSADKATYDSSGRNPAQLLPQTVARI
ncbi:MAG: flagella synthesis protein FlgN [Gammaproteobacteria bacterium]